MMQPFLDRHGLRVNIEPVTLNPMGPDSWQPYFVHYALWVMSRESGQGVPFYFSFDRAYLEPGSPFYAQATNPSPAFLFEFMAKVLYLHSLGWDSFWEHHEGLFEDDVRIYFDAITRALTSFERLLGDEALAELITLGGQL